MKKVLSFLSIGLFIVACNTKNTSDTAAADANAPDTLAYPYKATYSSDWKAPGDAAVAHRVLTVWKMFETADIQGMKPYYADTVTYEDASGMRFHGATADLLAYAKKDIEGLDSMRFDITQWQSVHSNDRNEDWVNIWSAERRYPKNGKPDTVLMQENWKVKDGKVVYFNQYLAKMPK